jgi:hypothetical protein
MLTATVANEFASLTLFHVVLASTHDAKLFHQANMTPFVQSARQGTLLDKFQSSINQLAPNTPSGVFRWIGSSSLTT